MAYKYRLSKDTLDNFQELMEDTIAYFCDEYMISGEMAYLLMETFAQAKQDELKGLLNADPMPE